MEGVKFILSKEDGGCYSKDKIVMELTPEIVEEIAIAFKELALKEHTNYFVQGKYREICDLFTNAFLEWRCKRDLPPR